MDIVSITNLFEALMIICFGISWPISIIKSLRSRTAKGKSVTFEYIIGIGYVFGMARKFIQIATGDGGGFLFYLALTFYCLNFLEIVFDIYLYYRNSRYDRAAAVK